MLSQFNFQGTRENLDQVRPILEAYLPGEVRQFILPVPRVVVPAMRVWKSYTEDQDKFSALFTANAFDQSSYEDFPARVGALWHTDVLVQKASNPKSDVVEVLEEAKPLHNKLSKTAFYLWEDDPAIGPIIADIRQGHSNVDRADDLIRYADIFNEHWSDVDGKCNVTKEDLEDAQRISVKVVNAMITIPASDLSELRDLRNRAGEYVRRGVEDIRDAARYVFRKDQDSLNRYPSLFKVRRRTNGKKESKEAADSTPKTEASTPLIKSAIVPTAI